MTALTSYMACVEAVAAQLRTITGAGFFNDFSGAGRVVIGSKTMPATLPGWRVTPATGDAVAVTFGRDSVTMTIFAELFLGRSSGSQRERLSTIYEAITDADQVLKRTLLRAQVLTLTGGAQTNAEFNRIACPVHDDNAISNQTNLPDAQIQITASFKVVS